MELGRFSFARSRGLVVVSLVVLCCSEFRVGAQQTSSPASTVPALPAAEPISQAAVGSARSTDSTKPTPSAASVSGVANEGSSSLRLGPGDLLEVGVYNVPELATKARIGNSGDVYLPLIDYVHVGDLTLEEAQALIQKQLEDGGFVRGAHVTIFLDESASQGVTILGEVTKPGIYPAIGDRRLYDLISAAGGFTSTAGRKVGVIRQRSQTGPITVNLPRNLADDLEDNIEILPGDTITVPRAPIIYVVGDVGRPAGLLVDNGSLTVLQALAFACGTNRTAKTAGVRVICEE